MATEVEAGIAAPVLEVGMALLPLVVGALGVGGSREACLAYEGRQQSVGVILQQHVDVLVLRRPERAVGQGHLMQREVLGVEVGLCLGGLCHPQGHES